MVHSSEGSGNDRKNSTKESNEAGKADSSATSENSGVSQEAPDVTVQYLTAPVRPDNDKKQYKAMKLANGLKVLLIADSDVDFNVRHDFQTALEGSVRSPVCEQVGNNNDSDPTSESAKIQMACFGLSIGVGSNNDPPEIPGMARFLEHMILLGSEKYPREHDFDAFIKKHGGYVDSYTGRDETTFKLTIPTNFLYDALDQFAQLLNTPVLKRDAVSRVRQFIIKRDNIMDEKLYERLERFKNRYYRAHNMTVTVEGPLQLDTLEEYVKDCFSSLLSDSLPSDYFADFTGADLFDIFPSPRCCNVDSITADHKMEFIWTIPSHYLMHSSKPLKYISWLICNSGNGSPMSYLRKKRWCVNIFSDFEKTRYISSKYNTTCSLSVVLTQEGFRNRKHVIRTVYGYINLMRREGPKQQIYDENRKIIEAKYRFCSEEGTVDPFDICKRMHSNASNEYLTGSDLQFEYDPDSIKACLNLLIPENAWIIFYGGPVSENDVKEVEPWFKMRYAISGTSQSYITFMKDVAPLPIFTLPSANAFVADNFTVIPVPDNPSRYPIEIHSDALFEIWYKDDTKFRLPQGYLNFHYISPLPSVLPENAAMLDLFVAILKELMFEELYPATVAGLNYQIYLSEKGLTIEVNGFNQKLTFLMTTITNYIAQCSDLVTKDVFNAFKEKQRKAYYYSMILTSDELAEDTRLSITRLTHWTAIDKLKAVSSVELDRFKVFTKSFAYHVYIQCLAQGNLEEIEVIQNVQDCVAILGCAALHSRARPRGGVIEVPAGIRCCRVKNVNPNDPLSVVGNYYQFSDTETTIAIELLNIIANDRLFEEFRTEQRLDCFKYHLAVDTVDVFGYSITGCDSSKNVDEIDMAVETFRKAFNTALIKMTEEELLTAKRAFIKIKQGTDFSLKDEVKKNWAEITSGTYVFDRLTRDVDSVSRLDVKELKELLINLTSDTPSLRKLSIQVIGNNADETEDVQSTSDRVVPPTHTIKLEYLTDLPNAEAKPDNYFISDIDDYKRGRQVFTVYGSAL